MAAPAGELLVKLALDMADFKANMTRAARETQAFKDRVVAAAGVIAGGFSVAGLVQMANQTVDAIARLDDLSDKTGLAVETLASLERVAAIGGHSLDTVASGASKFARSVAEAAGGNRELLDSFTAIGISQAQLQSQKFDDLYVRMATTIANATNQQNALAHATRLAGKGAAESMPFWKDLAEIGMQQARTTADMVKEADRLQKMMREWKLISSEASRVLVGDFLPAINKIAKALLEARKNGEGLSGSLVAAFRTAMTGDDLHKWNVEFSTATDRLLAAENNVARLQGRGGWAAARGLEAARKEAVAAKADVDRLLAIKPILAPEQGADGKNQGTDVAAPGGGLADGSREAEFWHQTMREIGELTNKFYTDQAAERERALKIAEEGAQRFADAMIEPYVQAADAQTAADVAALGARAAWRQGIEDSIVSVDTATAAIGMSRREHELHRAVLEADMTARRLGIELLDEDIAARNRLVEAILYQQQVERSWLTGATLAFKSYHDEATNMALNVERAFGNAFRGMEDALVQFAMTGKLNFRNFAESVIADIYRIQVRQSITGPLAAGLNTVIGGVVGGLFGGGGNAALNSAYALAGYAEGGHLDAGRWGIAGEEGPELIYGGNTGLTVVPNDEAFGGGGRPQFFIDARGADKAGLLELAASIRALNGSIEQRAVAAVFDAKRRGLS